MGDGAAKLWRKCFRVGSRAPLPPLAPPLPSLRGKVCDILDSVAMFALLSPKVPWGGREMDGGAVAKLEPEETSIRSSTALSSFCRNTLPRTGLCMGEMPSLSQMSALLLPLPVLWWQSSHPIHWLALFSALIHDKEEEGPKLFSREEASSSLSSKENFLDSLTSLSFPLSSRPSSNNRESQLWLWASGNED